MHRLWTAPILLALGLCACGEKDTDTGSTDTDPDTDATDTDTDAADTDVADTDPADTDAPQGADVMMPCEDLAFTVSCRKVVSGYPVCSDFFGANTEEMVRPQCEDAGGGTLSLDPCDMPERFGTCVYFNADLPDRCYMDHIAGDAAGASFWESTCPQVGGVWHAN